MLPTRLNLLPLNKQKNLQKMLRSEFIRSMLGMVIIVISIIGMALIGGKYILQTYFTDLAETIHTVKIDTKDENIKIEQVNQRVKTASFVFDSYYYWPTVLTEITTTVPDGIIINRLTADVNTKELSITGVAESRTSLLSFGDALRAVPLIDTVTIPISQLTEREDISFAVRATIKEQ